jgi:hypothetical protein
VVSHDPAFSMETTSTFWSSSPQTSTAHILGFYDA